MPGYHLASLDRNIIDSKYFCSSCALLLREVMQTSCGHFYCQSCLPSLIRDETSDVMECLVDKENFLLNQTFGDNFMRREVLALVVHCSFMEDGCAWRGEVRYLEDHERKECQYLKVPCVHDACSMLVKKSELADHLSNECRFRQQKCQHCDEFVAYCEIKEHLRLKHMYLHCQMDNLGDEVDDLCRVVYSLQDRDCRMLEETQQLQERLRVLQLRQDGFEEQQEFSSYEVGNIRRRLDTTQESTRRHDQRFESIENTLALRNVTLADLEEYVKQQEFSSYDGQLLWRISDYAGKRNDAVTGQQVSFYSPCFFTSRYGYKMCARIYLNGDGMGRGTHISIFFVVMRSKYDALLRWPFRQKVTFMLLDQDNVKHVIDSVRPDPNSSSFQRPRREMNIASGCPIFCSLAELNNHAYVRDDTMFLKIIVDTSDL